jgi:sarcosine oxidase/L-pipecolate oxidase
MAAGDVTYDVIVVGAGIMGSATAWELARRGQKVVLLEQFDFLHRRGSSHGESRIIRRTYPQDYYSVSQMLRFFPLTTRLKSGVL